MNDTNPVFRAAFLEWRASRPAWKVLVAAVRDEKPRADLDTLAGLAGVDHLEILDLLTQRAAAKAHFEDAARLPEARQRAAAAKRRLEAAEKMLNAKNLSIAEQDEARNEFEAAAIVARATEGATGVLQMSERFVSAAQAVGVL